MAGSDSSANERWLYGRWPACVGGGRLDFVDSQFFRSRRKRGNCSRFRNGRGMARCGRTSFVWANSDCFWRSDGSVSKKGGGSRSFVGGKLARGGLPDSDRCSRFSGGDRFAGRTADGSHS